MTTHQCLECGLPCPPRQRFCSDECFDLWKYGPGKGLTVNPGYSLIAAEPETSPEAQPCQS